MSPGRLALVEPEPIARARAHPQAGPRIVFLSGGSALRDLSRVITRYTHRSAHLITPFDSGGSSASLRQAFGMLSVGDLRNRLLALADDGSSRAAKARACFGHRFDPEGPRQAASEELRSLIAGRDPRIAALPAAQREFGQETLGVFSRAMPANFDLRGASVGNLALTGAYLPNRDIHHALGRFGEALGVRGDVLPTSEDDLHLAARLVDGTTVVGQHRLTAKQEPPLPSPIEELQLVASLEGGPALRPPASSLAIDRIRQADLICLPMGSFYSSLLCNLLPAGIGSAIANARCPKVYVPSTGQDPEVAGVGLAQGTARLLAALRADAGETTPTEHLLHRVLIDPEPGLYNAQTDLTSLDDLGVECNEIPLVAPGDAKRVDAKRLTEVLVSLARPRPPERKQPD